MRTRPRDGRPGEAGFALALVLLTLVLLGALASGGLLLTRTDFEVGLSHRSSVQAGGLAERGIATYLAAGGRMGGDRTYVFGSDSAVVEVTRLLEVDATYADTLYRLTSRGIRWIRGDRATRTLGRLVMDRSAPPALGGAITSGVRLEVREGSEVDGSDRCTASEVAGVAVPRGGYWLGDEDNVAGSPAVDSSHTDPISLLRSTGLDWDGLIEGTLVGSDYRVPDRAWPDFSTLPASEYPLIRITSSSYVLDGGHSGRGTILAEGEIDLSGSFEWDGLVLAGGAADVSSGNPRVEGAVVDGLDVLLGQSPSMASVSSAGSAAILYSSCQVRSAVAGGIRWVAEVPGSWFEVVAP